MIDDSPTLAGINPSSLTVYTPTVPALTVLWHPDSSRIGAMALLGGETPVALSRNEPTFDYYTENPAPLADTSLSRSPTLLFSSTRDSVEVRPLLPDVQVFVDGRPLTAAIFLSPAVINRGVVVTLGRRICLCLHFANPTSRMAGPDFGFVGNSDAINHLREHIISVAKDDGPVLLRGETGTGKELTANAIIQAGPRALKAFVPVNLGALPAQLAAAEIFGHEKGAFTGAAQSRDGYFQQANGGTLLLDEIGLAPPDVQNALLRVLETGQVTRLGGRTSTRVDVRVIAATDSTTIDQGNPIGGFSQPLFHRLSKATIHLPPLRMRREDIGILFLRFLEEALRRTGDLDRLVTPPGEKPWLQAQLMTTLALAPWPGNVRQLKNVAAAIARKNRSARSAVLPEELAPLLAPPASEPAVAARPSSPRPEPRPSSPRPEPPSHKAVIQALEKHGYNRAQAARALGISRTALYDHLRSDPDLGVLTKMSDQEFLRRLRGCNDDLKLLAERLRVSIGSVKLRASKLE
jgi:two-component system nitrogen regulation response regulator GlnG